MWQRARGFRLGDDVIVASTAVRFLGMPRDLLFLHFDDCDHAGHATGYGWYGRHSDWVVSTPVVFGRLQ